MDALLMCGGRGTRLDAAVEKPLFEVAGRPMVDRVVDALEGSDVGQVHPVVSPQAPDTRDHLAAEYEPVETAGEGYVPDLRAALEDRRVTRPVLTVVADLPLLVPPLVDLAVAAYDGRPLTVCAPAALKSALDLSADTTRAHGGHELAPAGLNVVAGGDDGTGEGAGTAADSSVGPEDAGSSGPEDASSVGPEDNGSVGPEDDGSVGPEDNSIVGLQNNTPATLRRAGDEDLLVSYDARLAVNVNRRSDAAVAEVLADGP